MSEASYGYTKTFEAGIHFEEAQARVTAALKESGFGVITEIDVRAVMKNKLNVERENYKILGACNPKIAHEVLGKDPFVGLLLPCNVIVFENDGRITVSAAKPSAMFSVVENPTLAEKARLVDELIQAAMNRL